jgi:hypothetical protein
MVATDRWCRRNHQSVEWHEEENPGAPGLAQGVGEHYAHGGVPGWESDDPFDVAERDLVQDTISGADDGRYMGWT